MAATAAVAAAVLAERAAVAGGVAAPNSTTLGALAADRGVLYGSATSTFQLRNQTFAPLLAQEARLLVAEYEMKRSAIEPQPGRFDFGPSETLLNFASHNGMAFRGHTLVWHKANPPRLEGALASPAAKERTLAGYIESVAGHFRGRMHSWDVVNEALVPEDGRSDNLRNSLWLKAFGPAYIDLAFHTARATDPHALLVYNDWGCEGPSEKHDRFRAVTLDFLERAKARGVPIDAYGMQGHLQAFGPKVDQTKLHRFLDALKNLGLRILVTEHDVDDSGGSLDTAVRDAAVADASRRFLDVVLDNTATEAVLTWGLSDRFLDPPGWKDTLRGYSPRLLPLDVDFVRKPMWRFMAQSFTATRPRLRIGNL
ncbi:MAG TPA: endo-1,4-beta-xylanase [Rhizomicrobium sp.]|nr:endo-1,4-beta-xylanase [Rhizomicrobium sp.]